MERITIDGVRERAVNVNRRLEGSGRGVVVEQRNGHVALDEYRVTYGFSGQSTFDACLRTITVGTKREVAEFLHAMMVGIDLSRRAS